MGMLLWRNSDADASRRPSLSITMPMRKSPAGVEGRTAFHLVAAGHPLQEMRGRPDQRLMLVYLRGCAVTQMHVACWRPLHHRWDTSPLSVFSIPRCRCPAYRKSWAGMMREAFNGLALNHAAAPGPGWLRCLVFAHSRVSLSP